MSPPTSRVAVKRGGWLRDYALDFIHTFAPTLTRERVRQALAAEPGQPGDSFEI